MSLRSEKPEAENPDENQTNPPSGEQAVPSDETLAAMLQQISDLSKERDELREQLARALADFQNFRRRTETEKGAIRAYATERFVQELLPVVDSFERGLQTITADTTVDQLKGGLESTLRQLLAAFATQHVVRIAAVGAEFNPDLHDALVTTPSDEYEDHTVLEELGTGYKMGDRVIRPARVRVSVKP